MTSRRGGRVPPDGRPPQAKGVGRNAKRHDLEKPKTPGLHGSDLQKGDVQQLSRGQRVQPIQEQPRGQTPQPTASRAGGNQQGAAGNVNVPDAIQFIGERAGGQLSEPNGATVPDDGKLQQWGPIIQRLVSRPGSSSFLAAAWVSQLRAMRQATNPPPGIVDLQDIDRGIEAMLDEGI